MCGFRKLKKFGCFVLVFILFSQILSFSSAFALTSVKITKLSKSPESPNPTQTILFRVRTEGEVESVYMSIENQKDMYFEKKSNNIWELERKLTVTGTRHFKVTAVGTNKSKDSINDTITVVEKPDNSGPVKTETTETTTERVYTGNIEKTTEAPTEETTRKIVGGDDFDGGEYNEEPNVDDSYFVLSENENMYFVDEVANSSVFMFINDNTFINKWKKQYIDDSNPEVKSYIKNGYTLVPLRVIAEAFNADVSWSPSARTANIVFMGKNISVAENSSVITVGQNTIPIDAPAEINNGRIFVPLRAIAEAINKNVYYKDNFIGITNKGNELSDKALSLVRSAVLRTFSD